MENIVDLIVNYLEEYDKKDHPFLLFDLAHVNENDHTRVLMGILKFNNYMFLPSFLQMIGAPDLNKLEIEKAKNKEILNSQKRAVGNSGTGFVDLYFEYKSEGGSLEKVIIENKINDAGDTPYQLARYIATVIDPEMTSNKFKEEIWKRWQNGNSYESFTDEVFSHIHVVYLTSDGSKKPEKKSLPIYFRNEDKDGNFDAQHIKYYPINYFENIIPWLENDVLPNMPYSDDGIAIAGIRQYITSLNAMFYGKGDSISIKNFVNKLNKSDLDKYNEIVKAMNELKSLTDKNKKDNVKDLKELESKGIVVDNLDLRPLLRELRAAATDIFSNDGFELGGDWKLYFTPSFIFLYRQRWADLDTRKYSIPSIYFMTFTSNFLSANKRESDIKWRLQVDHLDNKNADKNKKNGLFLLGNHDKTAYYEIQTTLNSCNSEFNVNDSKSRKKYYKRLLNKLDSYISSVNVVVDEVLNRKSNDEIFQEYVLRQLAEEIQNNILRLNSEKV